MIIKAIVMNIFCPFLNKVSAILLILFINTVVFSGNIYAQVKIIGFGDSITSGRPYSDADGEGREGYGGYEPVLKQLLSDAGKRAYVYNWGVGGEETTEGVGRIDSVLNSQESDYVLLMEGTNDQWRGVSSATTAFNLGVMIDKCRAEGTVPILGNLTPASRDTSNQIHNWYNPKIYNVAQAKDAIFVNHYSAVIDRWYDDLEYDSVHPNYDGYDAIAQNWFDTLILILPKPVNIGAIQLLLLD